MHPLLMKNQEQYSSFRRMTNEITKKLLGILKKHKDTKKINPKNKEYGFNEVVDYVIETTDMEEIRKVNIYCTTNNAVKSLNKIINDEVKKEVSKKDAMNKDLAVALKSQINAYFAAYGFFSIVTKDVYVVKDAHLQGARKEKKSEVKPKKSVKKVATKKKEPPKDTWKENYGYKPDRIPHKEWLRIHNRATLAHELFHYYLDIKTSTSNMMQQEEYAYSNMIGWYRKEGLKDSEIIKASLMWWGRTMAISKDNSLGLEERRKDFEKAAIIEAKKLMENYDTMCKTIAKGKEKYAKGERDIEDDIFLEFFE